MKEQTILSREEIIDGLKLTKEEIKRVADRSGFNVELKEKPKHHIYVAKCKDCDVEAEFKIIGRHRFPYGKETRYLLTCPKCKDSLELGTDLSTVPWDFLCISTHFGMVEVEEKDDEKN